HPPDQRLQFGRGRAVRLLALAVGVGDASLVQVDDLVRPRLELWRQLAGAVRRELGRDQDGVCRGRLADLRVAARALVLGAAVRVDPARECLGQRAAARVAGAYEEDSHAPSATDLIASTMFT